MLAQVEGGSKFRGLEREKLNKLAQIKVAGILSTLVSEYKQSADHV